MDKLSKDVNNYYIKKLLNEESCFIDIDNNVVYLSDKYIISLLPVYAFCLNKNMFNGFTAKYFYENVDMSKYNFVEDYKIVDKTVFLKDSLENEVCIDKKYFKLYEKCQFMISKECQFIIALYNNEIVAYILPIKIY